MADYLSDRYESMGMRGFLAVIMIIFLVPMMGAQTIRPARSHLLHLYGSSRVAGYRDHGDHGNRLLHYWRH